jgi:CHAT domain-containing protein
VEIASALEQQAGILAAASSGDQDFQQKLAPFAADLASPKRPEDVHVSERFVTGGADETVPREFTELIKTEFARDENNPVHLHAAATADFINGLFDEALPRFLRAVDLLEKDYRTLDTAEERTKNLAPNLGYYYTPMLILLDRKDTARAFQLLEASRARVLRDILTTQDRILLSDESQQALYDRLRTLRAELSRRAAAGTVAGDFANLEREYHTLHEQLRQTHPYLIGSASATPVPLSDVQAAATRGVFDVLEYAVLESQLVVWHVGPNGVHVRNVMVLRNHLAQKVAAFARNLYSHSAPFDETSARELYLFLVQPMKEFLSTERLVIIPHREIYHVPFAALMDWPDGRFVADRFRCSYSPSAGVLVRKGVVDNLSQGDVLALAGPNLPEAESEAREIVAIFGGNSRALGTNESTPLSLFRLAPAYQVIHIAAHGEFDVNEPLHSILRLTAPAGGGDGKLTAAAMFGLRLPNCRLVTLSACETGRVGGLETGELFGLPRALLCAGAKAVLVSRWKVESTATKHFMRRFYQEAKSVGLAEAVRSASAEVRKRQEFSHPYYWAAFDLIGQ